MAEGSYFDDIAAFFQELMGAAGSGMFDFSEEQLGAFSDILPVLGFMTQLKQLQAQGELSEAQLERAKLELQEGQGPYADAIRLLEYDKMQHEADMLGIQKEIAAQNLLGSQESTKQAKEYALARMYDRQTARDQAMEKRAELTNLLGLTQFPGFQRPSPLIGARAGDMVIG